MTDKAAVQPVLQGSNVLLRPFSPADADVVQELAGAREVAATTLRIPHPYGDGVASAWIATHEPGYAAGELASFAIVEISGQKLVGAIGLEISRADSRAELGYWVGVPFWNRGFATEAATIVLRFGFEDLGLNRIHAHHFSRNPASGRVLQKVGMSHEGRLRQHVRKFDTFQDIEQYGMLAADRLSLSAREPDV